MKITAIKQQVKRQDRYSIYIDGKYALSLGEADLLRQGLRSGQELDQSEFDNLKDQSTLGKAYDQTLNLISHRPRSNWELQSYLARKGYDEDTAKTVLGRLGQRGYINDADFAKRWVETRRLLKNTSRRRLSQELRQKRISDEIISQVLSEDPTDEKKVLLDLVARKRQQSKYQDKTKLMQYLVRQGFSYQDVKIAVNRDSETDHDLHT